MRRASPLPILLLPCLLLPAASVSAQVAPASPPERLPDIELLAHVTAESVQFHDDPKVDVTFPGTPGRQDVWHAVRTNLPDPIEVGKVYRNVEVDLVISTTLPAPQSMDATQTRSPR